MCVILFTKQLKKLCILRDVVVFHESTGRMILWATVFLFSRCCQLEPASQAASIGFLRIDFKLNNFQSSCSVERSLGASRMSSSGFSMFFSTCLLISLPMNWNNLRTIITLQQHHTSVFWSPFSDVPKDRVHLSKRCCGRQSSRRGAGKRVRHDAWQRDVEKLAVLYLTNCFGSIGYGSCRHNIPACVVLPVTVGFHKQANQFFEIWMSACNVLIVDPYRPW